MSEKIVVTPSQIRGWGNVLKEKKNSDFRKYKCRVTQSTPIIGGFKRNAFYIEGVLASYFESVSPDMSIFAVDMGIDKNAWLADRGSTVLYKLKLYNSRGTLLKNVNVKYYVNNTIQSNTLSTNNNGEVSLPFSLSAVGVYALKFVYDGSNTVEGCEFLYPDLYCGATVTLDPGFHVAWTGETFTLGATIFLENMMDVHLDGVLMKGHISDGSTNIYVSDYVESDTNGRVSFSTALNTPGWYDWGFSSVGGEYGSVDSNMLYIVDFDLEFYNLQIYLDAILGTHADSQMDSLVDLRESWYNLCNAFHVGSMSQYVLEPDDNVERFVDVLERIHAGF